MLSVSIDEFATQTEVISSELRAGHSLELLKGGKRIAEIVPAPTDEDRIAAWKHLLAIMEEGMDLGGVPPTRDEMHERF